MSIVNRSFRKPLPSRSTFRRAAQGATIWGRHLQLILTGSARLLSSGTTADPARAFSSGSSRAGARGCISKPRLPMPPNSTPRQGWSQGKQYLANGRPDIGGNSVVSKINSRATADLFDVPEGPPIIAPRAAGGKEDTRIFSSPGRGDPRNQARISRRNSSPASPRPPRGGFLREEASLTRRCHAGLRSAVLPGRYQDYSLPRKLDLGHY